MSSAIDRVQETLQPGASLREVEDGIWSAISDDPGAQYYDSFASTYDRVIGNRVYQRLAWGNDITRDTRLASNAARSSSGWFLDAGCGSLLFTDSVHAHSDRPTLLLDLSVGMLQRGRDRLVARCGRVPDHVLLVQGDVFALPFRTGSFETILCPGILHLFVQPEKLLRSLADLLALDGGFYLSALVTDRSFGARMLRWMEKRGEVHDPMTSRDLAGLIERTLGRAPKMDTQGNMSHAALHPRTAATPTRPAGFR